MEVYILHFPIIGAADTLAMYCGWRLLRQPLEWCQVWPTGQAVVWYNGFW